MKTSEFTDKLSRFFESDEESINKLSEDFDWLIECGYNNALYGYYPKYTLETNATAQGLMGVFGEKIQKAITGCAAVGWYQCAEDEDMIQEQMKKTLKHYDNQ